MGAKTNQMYSCSEGRNASPSYFIPKAIWSHTWKKGSQFKKLDLFFQYLKVQYIVG